MAWIFICICVASGTGCWVFGRWAMRPDGRADVFGFWLSLLGAIGAGILNVVLGKPFNIWPVWGAGVAFGVAYSIGFCILIMGALRVGPVGPTTTINNMALVCGVLFTILYLQPHVPNSLVIAGIVGVVVAIIMFGLAGSGAESGSSANRQWAAMVIPGGLLSGVSFISQAYAGMPRYSGYVCLYSFVGLGISAVILLVITTITRVSLFRRREMIAGISVGAWMSITVPMSIYVISMVGAEIALPIMVATPTVLVLLLGHFLYNERLQKMTVAACVVGSLSVALLSYGSGK